VVEVVEVEGEVEVVVVVEVEGEVGVGVGVGVRRRHQLVGLCRMLRGCAVSDGERAVRRVHGGQAW
jgi:hypothetical protein